MAKRSLFEKIFGKKDNISGTSLQVLNGYTPVFTNYNGCLYQSTTIRTCIDAIARNGAKLSPKHVRSNTREFANLNDNIARLISQQPNEIDNAFSFYYKVISQLYLNNNAFVYIQRDHNGVPTGLYPLNAGSYRLVEYKNEIYVSFSFRSGQKYTASLKDDIIHLKRFYCEDDIMGNSTEPIVKTMSIHHIIQEGIVNAIKTTQSIKGILKTTKAMLKPEDIKATRDRFVADFIDSNNSSIASIDATTDFIPVSLSPQTASESQVRDINDEIKNYYGVSDAILSNKYTEEEWNAFYNSCIEPLALQMSLEFTNKLFTITERFHGNKVVFECSRLEYASNNTKINIARYMNNYMTINEIRRVFNLEPVEDGDRILQDLNHIDSDIANDYQGGTENE